MMAGDSEKYSPDQLPEPDLVDMIGDTETEKKKAKRYVSWINGNYDSEESKRDHRVALRMFGGTLLAGILKTRNHTVSNGSRPISRMTMIQFQTRRKCGGGMNTFSRS